MSTRPRRTRGGGHRSAQDQHHPDGEEPLPDIETPIPPRDRRVTFSEAPTSLSESVNIDSVLHVPDSPYNIDQIHFVLWYTFTTTLNPDKIAELVNHFFKPAQPIDRWAIADIVNAIETRWENNGKSFGANFRLRRPTEHGTCPCDFPGSGIDCLDVKRTTQTRQNQKYLSIAAALWDQSAADLVSCPRGRKKGLPDAADTTAAHHTFPFDAITKLVQDFFYDNWATARMTAALIFWLSILNVWLAPSDSLHEDAQNFRLYLHDHPTFVLATLHFLLQTFLDGVPNFSRVRAMPFGEYAWHAFRSVALTALAIQVALLVCSILGGLQNIAPPIAPSWMHDWQFI